jgi:hypothetical protein
MATLVFSGKVYEGNVIKVVNGRIIVDGVDQGAVPISKEEPIKFSEDCDGSIQLGDNKDDPRLRLESLALLGTLFNEENGK